MSDQVSEQAPPNLHLLSVEGEPREERPLERVVWVDSGLSYASTWLDEETVIDRAKEWNGRVTTVGHLIYEDDSCVVLGLSHDTETGNWSGAFLIYKPTILERYEIARAVG
jgi:hypothetical protein